MKIIDLTHIIEETMPVYPGTEPPKLVTANTIEKDGFRETLLTMFSHTGTHMDAPAHLFDGRTTLDEFDVSQFAGDAVVIDCRELADGEPITMEIIRRYGEKAVKAEFLLFNLGWDKKWGTEEYFGDFPCIDDGVLDFIISTGKKGIGFDVISVDPISDVKLTRHKKLLSKNEFVNIENLRNLDKCGDELFTFLTLPLKFKNSDGAPVRAVAILK